MWRVCARRLRRPSGRARRCDGVIVQTSRSRPATGRPEDRQPRELAKVCYQEALTTLEVPVDDTIQQLAIHTVRGVGHPGPALDGHRVPAPTGGSGGPAGKQGQRLHDPGQAVTVKVETFTYTKYGTLDGTVVNVSRDAARPDLQQQDPPGPRPPEYQWPRHQVVARYGGNRGSEDRPAPSDRVLPKSAAAVYE